MFRIEKLVLLCGLFVLACGSDSGAGDGADVPATTDTGGQDSVVADVDDMDEPDAGDQQPQDDTAVDEEVADVSEIPEPYPVGLPPTDQLGRPHGFHIARGVLHVHSVFSHDACDGQPVLEDGAPNESCLEQFRHALCADRIDVAMMSEHYDLMTETFDFDELYLHRDGDTWVDEGGKHSANQVNCDGGHVALIMPGLEGSSNRVSPLAITGHPVEGTAEEIEAAYKDDSPEGVARLRAKNAIPTAIHIESDSNDWLHTTDLDALEIGNLHVLIAPNYRSDLGMDPGAPIAAFAEYLFNPENLPWPDLVFLEFHERMPLYYDLWDEILSERMIAGFAGNDAHQNVSDHELFDGERGDSYRRMFKWYGNHLLVSERTPAQAREALSIGRLYMVYEVLGSPVGFDFWTERGDDIWVMGESADSGGQPSQIRLRATIPTALVEDQAVEVPVSMRLYRVTSDGSELVLETEQELDLAAPGVGRYRLEVDMTPENLAPYLRGHERLVRQYPWIYSNPIEIR